MIHGETRTLENLINIFCIVFYDIFPHQLVNQKSGFAACCEATVLLKSFSSWMFDSHIHHTRGTDDSREKPALLEIQLLSRA